MAILFNEKEFEKLIIKKGEEYGDPVLLEVELEAYKNSGNLEYLFYVYHLGLALKNNNIAYFIRLDGYPSSMISILGLNSPETRNGLQNWKYDEERKNIFQFFVPVGLRKKILSLFLDVAYIETDNDEWPCYLEINHKYKIELVQHGYLNRLNNVDPELRKKITPDDKSVIDYMIKADDQGYYMPSLYECCGGGMDLWYSLINVADLKNLDDFRKIVCLINGIFSNRKVLVKHIKEFGLNNIICCREQLYSVLCDSYDIDKQRVDTIRMHLNGSHHLTESDELLLESNEVPDYIIKQLNNIRYLPYASHSVVTTEIIYRLVFLKLKYWEEYSKLIKNDETTFVGPFFYINNKILASKKPYRDFDTRLRFYDSDVSHFDFFPALNVDGDYGNYPRGRVIYDNYNVRYIVYLDKSLVEDEVKTQIKKLYSLEDEIVVFKTDSHYTHNGLWLCLN